MKSLLIALVDHWMRADSIMSAIKPSAVWVLIVSTPFNVSVYVYKFNFVCTHACTSTCFPISISILWLCVDVPSLLWRSEYECGSRLPRCLFHTAVNNASEVVAFSHPSLSSFSSNIHLLAHFASRMVTAFKAGRNLILIHSFHPLLIFINMSIFSVSLFQFFQHFLSWSHVLRCKLKHRTAAHY